MRELESAKKIIDFEDFLQANEFYEVIYLLFFTRVQNTYGHWQSFNHVAQRHAFTLIFVLPGGVDALSLAAKC